jgi:hypothetical protein
MKALIAIPSCARDRALQFTQRALVEQDGIDYRFFLGAGNCAPAFDEVILPVRDDYWALPAKVRAAFRWALEHEYTHVFKCDRDTFVHVDRLLAAVPVEHDFVGLVGNPGDCCGGGAGYWLSRHAMITYLENYDERQPALANYQRLEDWCLFTVLDRASPRLSPVCDRRYWDLRLGPVPDPETNITWNPWKP